MVGDRNASLVDRRNHRRIAACQAPGKEPVDPAQRLPRSAIGPGALGTGAHDVAALPIVAPAAKLREHWLVGHRQIEAHWIVAQSFQDNLRSLVFAPV